MHLYALCVALAVFVAKETESLKYCPSRQHPCRYRSYFRAERDLDLCRCRSSECPTDWADRRKVITFDRTIIEPGHRIDTHQFMFCNDVIPLQHCKNEDEEPIWIQYPKGSYASAILRKASCMCKETTPLLIKYIFMGHGLTNYNEVLICSDMMPPCDRKFASSVRRIMRHRTRADRVFNNDTEHHCKCEVGVPSSQWNDRDRVVTIDDSPLWYRTHNTIEYVFCNRIIPRTICSPSKKLHEEPLTFISDQKRAKTRYELTKLKFARCRCPDAQPMMLKRTWMTRGSMIYHECFVCRFDLPQLKATDHCITTKPTLDVTIVHGICLRGLSCSILKKEYDLPIFLKGGSRPAKLNYWYCIYRVNSF